MSTIQKISPNLWFNGNAEEAANYYVSIFPNSRIGRKLLVTEDGQLFQGLNGGPQFTFNEAVSFVVNCKDQVKVNRAMASMMQMKKLDIAEMQRAFND